MVDTTTTEELNLSQRTSYRAPWEMSRYHGRESITGSLIKLLYTLSRAANATRVLPTLTARDWGGY